jgi:peptidoglycan hydrolase-like protein with peptidoglycan-binding domain
VRAATARLDDGNGRSWLSALVAPVVRFMLRRPRDSVAGAVAGAAAITILINALFMQSGPHPAPIFANRPAPVSTPAAPPSPRIAVEIKGDVAPMRSDTVAEIQRQLGKRGFFYGTPDGIYGPKTDAAIRDFEQAAHLRPSAEPNDVLLATITRSSLKAQPAVAARSDPIAALLGPNPRILAVQRALTDFGYGPVMPTGVYDAGTRLAIERFEKARKRPMTGQISDQLVRELATLTGRPLE